MSIPTPSPARVHDFIVVANEPVAEGVYRLTIEAPRLALAIRPGQFMSFAVPGDRTQLTRVPVSFSDADRVVGTVETYYAVVGDGTRRLSQMTSGSMSTVFPTTPWRAPSRPASSAASTRSRHAAAERCASPPTTARRDRRAS